MDRCCYFIEFWYELEYVGFSIEDIKDLSRSRRDAPVKTIAFDSSGSIYFY